MKRICVLVGIAVATVAVFFHRSVTTQFDLFWYGPALILGVDGALLGLLVANRIGLARRWKLYPVLLGAALAIGGCELQYRSIYPYGWSHSCDKQLMFALDQYAQEHDGAYPAGEATPEASLSLLYPKYANEWVLQGKTIPLHLVKATLERGDRLGPDTCGWHYVEGLRLDDDRRLALCWDKVGLGHNGESHSAGGRTVLFVNMGYNSISGDKWEEFLEEQKTLLANRKKK